MQNFWDYNVWGFFNVMAVLLGSLLAANILKRTIPMLKRSLIPHSVLGGGILQNEELFRRIDACTRTQLMPGFEVVQLKQAQLGNRAGMIGAALLAEQML